MQENPRTDAFAVLELGCSDSVKRSAIKLVLFHAGTKNMVSMICFHEYVFERTMCDLLDRSSIMDGSILFVNPIKIGVNQGHFFYFFPGHLYATLFPHFIFESNSYRFALIFAISLPYSNIYLCTQQSNQIDEINCFLCTIGRET